MGKTVCKTNIRNALRKSWDSGNYEDVTDEWMIEFGRNGSYLDVAPMCERHVRMWNCETGEELFTNVGGCCSMTEYVNFATDCVLRMWDERERKLRTKTFWAVLDEWVGGMTQWASKQLYVTFDADVNEDYRTLRLKAIDACEKKYGKPTYEYGVREMDARSY